MPGPTNVPMEVLRAMNRPSTDVYAGELVGVTDSCIDDLKRVFRTSGSVYLFAANGHGAWEAAISNVLSRGEKALVLSSGIFARGWGEMGRKLGVEIEILDAGWGCAVDPRLVEERLQADRSGAIKAILVVQVDTGSSVVNDIPAIRRAIDAARHDALLLVDTIASLATTPFEMDGWGVDVAVGASQKGLMMSPGLSFNAVSDKAHAAHATANLVTGYWDWTFRRGAQHYMKYCGTPPVHLVYGLRKSLDILLAEGLEAVFARHATLANAVRQAVAGWAAAGVMDFNVQEPSQRSNSVTTVTLKGFDPQPLLEFARAKCGIILGLDLSDRAERGFRIAHMGHVNAAMLLATLGVIETAMTFLDIPHGAGTRAAILSLASELKTSEVQRCAR